MRCDLSTLTCPQVGYMLLRALFILILLPQSGLTLLWQVDKPFDGLTTDKVGNSYAWRGQELIKIDRKGNETFTYSELRYGDIESIDATNSFKIRLFYKEHGLIRILDNSLSDRSIAPFNLIEEGFALPTLICGSFDNGTWVWDQALLSITRFDQQRNRTVQVESLNQLVDRQLQPTAMFESGSRLYLVDEGAVLEFDLFGAYLKSIPIPDVKDVQVEENTLFYRSSDTLFSYHLQKFDAGSYILPNENIEHVTVTNSRLLTLDKVGLKAFSLK
ncbi:MAG: hypothetical protein ACI97X_002288 [Oceanospirillaceae bacterium]